MIGKRADYDLIVIGSGRSGREEALAAAEDGRRVAIVEAGLWGGNEINYGGIPFGVLLETSQAMRRVEDDLAVMSDVMKVRYDALIARAADARAAAAEASLAEVQDTGVEIVEGFAKFISTHEINVNEKVMRAKTFFIATGKGLRDNKIAGVEEAGCLDIADVVSLKRMPRTVFVVGAGTAGCEIAQYFSGIGSRVLIADIAGRLLPDEEEEAGQLMDQVFNNERIVVLTQTRVTSVERDSVSRRVVFMQGGVERAVRVDEIVLATGRVLEIHDLGLERAGVEVGRKAEITDKEGRTSQKHIFAASGAKRFVTRTLPAIVRLGMSEDECLKADERVTARIEKFNGGRGFVKTLVDSKGMLCGATFVGDKSSMLDYALANPKDPAVRALLDDSVSVLN